MLSLLTGIKHVCNYINFIKERTYFYDGDLVRWGNSNPAPFINVAVFYTFEYLKLISI